MPGRVRVRYGVTLSDAQGIHLEQIAQADFAPGVVPNGKREPVTVAASGFTALSPPSGAKGMAIILNGALGLTLKSITGDQGIPITPTANAITGFDLIMPLGASPSVGLASSSSVSQVVEVLWL